MKKFINMHQIKKKYFPISTAKEQEKEFMKTATPAEIGRHWAKQSIEKFKGDILEINK